MPEVTDLGYCPRCGIDLTEVPIGFVKHVKFCRICRDSLRDYPVLSDNYVAVADELKERQKSCNQQPITNDIKPSSPKS